MQRRATEESSIEQKSPGLSTSMAVRHWWEKPKSSVASAQMPQQILNVLQLDTALLATGSSLKRDLSSAYPWLPQEET